VFKDNIIKLIQPGNVDDLLKPPWLQFCSQTTGNCGTIRRSFLLDGHLFTKAGHLRKIAVLLVLTLALTLTPKFFVAPNFGRDVESRFLERLRYIPSQTDVLSRATLARWLAAKENEAAISGYIYPVLFPLDLLFLVSLGLLLGFASTTLSDGIAFLSNIPAWIWWAFPALYMISDLAEDSAIAAIFGALLPLTDGSFALLRVLTSVKLATVGIAIGQAGFLAALSVLLFFFPASEPI